jgi:CheY-specific phosphatase CheX
MIDQLCISDMLLESAKEIFETMIYMDIEEVSQAPVHSDSDTPLLSSITFKGALEGCMALCCSEECTNSIALNMLGMDSTDELTKEDAYDAIGEVSNMVIGCLKRRLAETIGDLEISVPSVVNASKLNNNFGVEVTRTSVYFSIDSEHTAELSILYRESK